MNPLIKELRVERRKLSDLKLHPKNPRVHPAEGSEEFEALRKSLEFDYFDPLVLNERNGMLVSGHYRRKVFEVMKVTEVDVVIVDYDEPTHLARILAANKQFGDWDEEAVAELQSIISDSGLDSWMAGFLEVDWDENLDVPDDLEDDVEEIEELVSRAEELQLVWQVKPGEMFEAGGQKLVCGDCTDASNWERMLQGESADMVWTDPPYNVAYDGLQEHRNRINRKRGKGEVAIDVIQNDELSDDDYSSLLTRAFQTAADHTKKGGAIYIAHADGHRGVNQDAMEAAGFMMKQNLIWVKSGFTLGRQDYQWQHEPILYGWKEGAAHFWQGGFGTSTVIDEVGLEAMDRDELLAYTRELSNELNGSVIREPKQCNTSTKIGHPTIKPTQLVARQIWNSSRKNEMVLELFGGSGTTLLACENTGRRGVATELEPKFCAVILERLKAAGLEIVRYEPEAIDA